MEHIYLLRPASAGELLDTAIGIVRQHFLAFLGKAWLPYVVGMSVDILTRVEGAPASLRIVSVLVGMAVGALVEVRLACASRDLLEGRAFGATPFAPIFRRRWAAIFLGYLVKWMFVICGLFLVVLPGVYMLILYFGVPCLSGFENLGVRAARHRSRDLARPHLGRIFATIGAFDLGAALLSLGVLLALGHGSLRQVPESARVINWLVGLLIAPIRASLTAAVYLDCRIRSEGYDLEHAVTGIAEESLGAEATR